MLIPAASHSGASAVLAALPISGLKRHGRSAALAPFGCRLGMAALERLPPLGHWRLQ